MDRLSHDSDDAARREHYAGVRAEIEALVEGSTDWISAMATVASELHGAFDYFHWTGFYRLVKPELLVVGPYQGGHGCLEITLDRGVCGAAARERATQRVADVEAFPGHIACSSTTRSEIVVPVISPAGRILGVLDVDSDLPDIFTDADQDALESLCAWLGERWADTEFV